ncbi:hypothetical protein Lal_00035667 [Lupinus albus]|nr:hypothetical protein Lal_00035667 [Lupinus albus]
MGLRQGGWQADWVQDGEAAGHALASEPFAALVLDLGLPKVSGLEVLRQLRARGDAMPVLILTARDAPDDVVAGLDAGADDYMIKPFNLQELGARLRALTRRRGGRAVPEIVHGNLRLDPAGRRVTLAGQAVELSAREFDLLHELLAQAGRVLTKAQIESHLYAWGSELESNAIEPAGARRHDAHLFPAPAHSLWHPGRRRPGVERGRGHRLPGGPARGRRTARCPPGPIGHPAVRLSRRRGRRHRRAPAPASLRQEGGLPGVGGRASADPLPPGARQPSVAAGGGLFRCAYRRQGVACLQRARCPPPLPDPGCRCGRKPGGDQQRGGQPSAADHGRGPAGAGPGARHFRPAGIPPPVPSRRFHRRPGAPAAPAHIPGRGPAGSGADSGTSQPFVRTGPACPGRRAPFHRRCGPRIAHAPGRAADPCGSGPGRRRRRNPAAGPGPSGQRQSPGSAAGGSAADPGAAGRPGRIAGPGSLPPAPPGGGNRGFPGPGRLRQGGGAGGGRGAGNQRHRFAPAAAGAAAQPAGQRHPPYARRWPGAGLLPGAGDGGADAVLHVRDSGPGIPAEQRQEALARFRRLDPGAGDGHGLGLSIVTRIAELHGARLSLGAAADLGGLDVAVAFPVRARQPSPPLGHLRPFRRPRPGGHRRRGPRQAGGHHGGGLRPGHGAGPGRHHLSLRPGAAARHRCFLHPHPQPSGQRVRLADVPGTLQRGLRAAAGLRAPGRHGRAGALPPHPLAGPAGAGRRLPPGGRTGQPDLPGGPGGCPDRALLQQRQRAHAGAGHPPENPRQRRHLLRPGAGGSLSPGLCRRGLLVAPGAPGHPVRPGGHAGPGPALPRLPGPAEAAGRHLLPHRRCQEPLHCRAFPRCRPSGPASGRSHGGAPGQLRAPGNRRPAARPGQAAGARRGAGQAGPARRAGTQDDQRPQLRDLPDPAPHPGLRGNCRLGLLPPRGAGRQRLPLPPDRGRHVPGGPHPAGGGHFPGHGPGPAASTPRWWRWRPGTWRPPCGRPGLPPPDAVGERLRCLARRGWECDHDAIAASLEKVNDDGCGLSGLRPGLPPHGRGHRRPLRPPQPSAAVPHPVDAGGLRFRSRLPRMDRPVARSAGRRALAGRDAPLPAAAFLPFPVRVRPQPGTGLPRPIALAGPCTLAPGALAVFPHAPGRRPRRRPQRRAAPGHDHLVPLPGRLSRQPADRHRLLPLLPAGPAGDHAGGGAALHPPGQQCGGRGLHPPCRAGGHRGAPGRLVPAVPHQPADLPRTVPRPGATAAGGLRRAGGPGGDGPAEDIPAGEPAAAAGCPGVGGAGEPGQIRVRRQHEPRAAHPHERRPRHGPGAAGNAPGRGAAGIRGGHQQQWRIPAGHHQRHPGPVEDRSRPARPGVPGLRPGAAAGPGDGTVRAPGAEQAPGDAPACGAGRASQAARRSGAVAPDPGQSGGQCGQVHRPGRDHPLGVAGRGERRQRHPALRRQRHGHRHPGGKDSPAVRPLHPGGRQAGQGATFWFTVVLARGEA